LLVTLQPLLALNILSTHDYNFAREHGFSWEGLSILLKKF